MNVITLVGRAGRDPEVRYFESGTMVANLTLAVNAFKKDDEPDWFNLEIWGKQAQVAADYVRKGALLGIIGRSTTEKWIDKATGEQRSKPIVNVERLTLLGSKRDSEGDAQPAPAAAPAHAFTPTPPMARAAAPQPAWNTAPISDEEVPF
jgi:single-strand DNA-binding protein